MLTLRRDRGSPSQGQGGLSQEPAPLVLPSGCLPSPSLLLRAPSRPPDTPLGSFKQRQTAQAQAGLPKVAAFVTFPQSGRGQSHAPVVLQRAAPRAGGRGRRPEDPPSGQPHPRPSAKSPPVSGPQSLPGLTACDSGSPSGKGPRGDIWPLSLAAESTHRNPSSRDAVHFLISPSLFLSPSPSFLSVEPLTRSQLSTPKNIYRVDIATK